MSDRQRQILNKMMIVILLMAMYFVAKEGAVYVNSLQVAEAKSFCVVIDAGHADSKLR